METHRYCRRQVPSGSLDSYNSLAVDYPPQHSNVEYWTNGTTTLLNVMSVTTSSELPRQTHDQLPTRISSRRKDSSRQASANINTNTATGSNNTNSRSKNAVRNSILAGSLAGIASTALVYPFDVVRTKLQSSAQQQTQFRMGPVQALRHTFAHGGTRALYTGLSLPLTAQAVYKATVFSTNQWCQKAIVDHKTFEHLKRGKRLTHQLTLWDHFICGFTSGAVNAALFVTPVEFVRNQLIAQHSKLASSMDSTSASTTASSTRVGGPLQVIRSTVASPQGVAGLWRGIGMTVARDSLGCGGFFVVLHWSRSMLSDPSKDEKTPSWGVTVLSGACAGLGFWAIALPLDTLKTWVQNGTAESASSAIQEAVQSHGYWKTAQQLCRGWQVAFGRGAPSAAITIGTYEYFYQKMEGL